MTSGAREFVDGVGRTVRLDHVPRRVVSLVPSTTETLFALGCGERVVGRTRYCVHPQPAVADVPDVGGTKAPDLVRIADLRPDLIVANEEENRPALWPALEQIAALWVAYPRGVDEAVDDLRAMASVFDVSAAGDALLASIATERRALRALVGDRAFRFAYLVWRDPWMAAGDDTYIDALLAEAGGRNVVVRDGDARYPRLQLEDLERLDPDVVLLASEPYPFGDEDVAALGPLAARALLVDGEHCSWHGARLARALPYLSGLLRGPLDELAG